MDAAAIEFPLVSGRLVDRRGTRHRIRFWPAAEEGVFEAEFDSPRLAGQYDIEVAAGADVLGDAMLAVVDDAAAGVPDDNDAQMTATATGGVAVAPGDLTALEEHLRALPRRVVASTIHPGRSPWWALAFAGTVCAEWVHRRRRGLP